MKHAIFEKRPTPGMHVYPTDIGTVLITDPALLPTCSLKKLSTDDGRWRYIKKKAFVGKTYKYSPASRQTLPVYNKAAGTKKLTEIVLVFDQDRFVMMPTECLDFNPPAS